MTRCGEGGPGTRIAQSSDNSDEQMTMMTPAVTGNVTDGYVAEVTVGVAA